MAVRRRPMKKKYKKILFVFILVLALLVLFMELRLRPVTQAVAERQAQIIAVEAIDTAVLGVMDEMDLSYDDLEDIVYGDDGSISSINTNTLAVNKLKANISSTVQEAIGQVESRYIEISIGTIVGMELLNGRGPKIPLYLSDAGSIQSDFESSFESGGVNQTLHKLSINISMDVTVILPLSSFTTTVTTSVLIAETVIVGDVPSGYLYTTSL